MQLIDRLGFDAVDAGPLEAGLAPEPDGPVFGLSSSADELFFDLAYVLAFSQLLRLLVDGPTWSGAGKLLFEAVATQSSPCIEMPASTAGVAMAAAAAAAANSPANRRRSRLIVSSSLEPAHTDAGKDRRRSDHGRGGRSRQQPGP